MNLHDVHCLPWYDSDQADPRQWLTLYLPLTVIVHDTRVYGARPYVIATPTGNRVFVALKSTSKLSFVWAENALDWLKAESLPEEAALRLLREASKASPPTEAV